MYAKARERELATFDENRRSVGVLSPVHDQNQRHVPGGGGGTTPETTACPDLTK